MNWIPQEYCDKATDDGPLWSEDDAGISAHVKNGVKPNHVPIHYQETDGVHTGQNSAGYA